jgi:hypothetical protein
MAAEPELVPTNDEAVAEEAIETHKFRVIGWFSVGMAVAALGIYLGSEIRSRYRFRRRTPYDFYSNAGEQHASEFGMGI